MGIRDRVRKFFGRRIKEKVLEARQTPEGLRIAGTTAEPEPLPESTGRIAVEKEEGESTKHACGHTAPRCVSIHCFGASLTLSDEAPDKCSVCHMEDLKKVVIRCGSCGLPILPGDGIALYGDNQKHFKDRTRITLHGKSVIGCMRWNCCPSGGFYAGIWDGSKVLSTFPDGLSAAELAMKTGKIVIVSNTGPDDD